MTTRELDALVAQARGWVLADRKAKGWGDGPPVWLTGEDPDDEHGNPTYQDYRPSSNIAEAMALVEELRRGGNGKAACCIRLEITDYPVEQDCRCTIYGPDQAEVSADGHELPEAICLAYLKARGVDL